MEEVIEPFQAEQHKEELGLGSCRVVNEHIYWEINIFSALSLLNIV